MKKRYSSESGQILILLVLVIIGLLGFTALAIDGGMIFADRRYSQSAADAASLAGAGAAADIVQANNISMRDWNCSSTSLASSVNAAINAAIASAGLNDYVIAADGELGVPGHDHGVRVSCSQGSSVNDDYLDVEVMLSRETNTSFVHLFTGGVMRNTVYSKTRVRPQLKGGDYGPLVSLGDGTDKQLGGNKNPGCIWLDSASLELYANGAYSNTCVIKNKNATTSLSGEDVTCHEGYEDKCDFLPEASLDPEVHPLTGQELIPNMGERCIGLQSYGSSDGNINKSTGEGEISYGNYTSWTFDDPVHLLPGLYCVSGTVRMGANGAVYGEGVTIYYTGNDFTINGNVGTDLLAPNAESEPPITAQNGAVEDVLLYVPLGVEAIIKINGTSDNTFGGTIFAPDSSIHITGTSDSSNPTEFTASLIGASLWFSGTSVINFNYQKDSDAGWPSFLQVQK